MFLFGLGESTAIAVIMGYIFYRIAGLYIVSTIFSIGLICLFYIWHRASTAWQRLGVPSPPGRFFLGHYDQYAKKGTYVCDLEWSKKYGKIYGAYLYMYPELISDSELLKKILVKDFHNFTNRRIEKMDMLQLLINAVDDAEMGSDTVNYNGTRPMQKWKLTDRDVIAHSLNTVFAGYSPISTTLTLACYLLAWHPDIQKKCQEELTDTVNDDEPITYSHIQQGMPYLEGVISETLRLYPPVLRFDRVSQDDYQLTDKITIPKEAVVVIPVYAIHHDPEKYEDPERFNPERFLESVNRLTYLPFGYGPRNCVGMRFAQLEMKLVLANIVRKFRIETCSKTEPMPLQLNVTRTLQPKNPIRLNFKRQ